jgi:hypothetical protein
MSESSFRTWSSEDFRRVRELFDAALEQPPAQRATFLERACQGNPALRDEVWRMLGAEAGGKHPLLDEVPASMARTRQAITSG